MEKVLTRVKCNRCGGQGGSEYWVRTGYTCYKCGGSKLMDKWITVRTPEEQERYEKSKARREAKKLAEQEAKRIEAEKRQAEWEEVKTKKEAERLAKAHKGFVGSEGEKIKVVATGLYMGEFERPAFHQTWGRTNYETVRVYTFETEDRKLVVWKTTGVIPEFGKGIKFEVTGTVKEHTTYKDEDQTMILRVKVKDITEY